jgi:hypothetical protein
MPCRIDIHAASACEKLMITGSIGDISAVIASEAKQSSAPRQNWIASSQALLAMTGHSYPDSICAIY